VTASSSDIDAVYRAHAPSVFRRARILLADDEDAQRVVTDVFGLLYDRPERYVGQPALSVQLYALTTRACFNRLRSRALRRTTKRQAFALDDTAAQGSQPRPQDDLSARASELRNMLDDLDDPLAQLAVYYYLDELSQEEVGAVLGFPRRRVTNLLLQLSAAASSRELRQ
jgi:RNA polymerase sigma-70 factor (ECF subfamily)